MAADADRADHHGRGAQQAAAEAGVDRSTVMMLRKTARDGAIAALQASRPGRPKQSRVERSEIAGLTVEVERLAATIVEQAVELAALRGKAVWGLSGPIPARLDSAAKTVLLDLIDNAVKAGWTLGRICGVLELDRQRAWRWRHRQLADRLDDAAPGGNPVHGLLAWEEAEILALFEDWGAIDLSHRKLAHRGSYLERVWVSPSTVDRVLARNGLALQGLPRPARSVKKPWPDWVEWRPNQLWCWDASHFPACTVSPVVYGIVDVVSRKWIASLLCSEQTGTQVKVVFLAGLEAEGLLTELEWRLDHPSDVDLDDDAAPILLAVSDN